MKHKKQTADFSMTTQTRFPVPFLLATAPIRLARTLMLITLACFAAAHGTWAGTSYIVRPVLAANSPALELNQGGPTSRLIDNSGLAQALNTGDPIPGSFPTHQIAVDQDGDPDNDIINLEIRWFNAPSAGSPDVLTFDLGGVFALDSFYLWNYTENFHGSPYNNRGVGAFQLAFSLDGNLFDGVQDFNAEATPDFAEPEAQTFSLSPVSAAFVRLTINSNHGGNLTGLSEVRFGAGSEPSQPVITTISASIGTVTLSWPASATGFVLQSASTLANGGDWQDSSLTPTIANGQKSVTVPPNGPRGFFRLRGP